MAHGLHALHITTSAVTRTHNFCTSCQESCCKQYILCTLSGAEFTSPSRILLVIVAPDPRCMFCVSGGHPGPWHRALVPCSVTIGQWVTMWHQLVTRLWLPHLLHPAPCFLTPPRAPTWGNADIKDCPRLIWLLSITNKGDPELFYQTEDWGRHFALNFGKKPFAQNKISHVVLWDENTNFFIITLQAEAPLVTIRFHLRAVLTGWPGLGPTTLF